MKIRNMVGYERLVNTDFYDMYAVVTAAPAAASRTPGLAQITPASFHDLYNSIHFIL
jgi:hypothetical protein